MSGSGSDGVEVTDLRERRRRQTKAELVEAALGLFEEDGYDAVTMEQIAAAAGVSRRTLYRHFPTKDRILLDLPVEWMAIWDEVVGQLPLDTPPRAVIEGAARAVAAELDADGARIRAAWRIIDAIPTLEPAFLANPMWVERFVALLTDPLRGDPFEPRVAVVIAGAYLGAVDATMFRWAARADESTVAAAVDLIIAQLAPIWPKPPRTRR